MSLGEVMFMIVVSLMALVAMLFEAVTGSIRRQIKKLLNRSK